MKGMSRAISSKIWDALSKSNWRPTSRPTRRATRLASSAVIHQSGRASPGGGTAARTRCTRRSELVKVPSFSANAAAGRKTWPSSAVSCMNRSWTTRQSSWAMAFVA
jgi:hypothetical protein